MTQILKQRLELLEQLREISEELNTYATTDQVEKLSSLVARREELFGIMETQDDAVKEAFKGKLPEDEDVRKMESALMALLKADNVAQTVLEKEKTRLSGLIKNMGRGSSALKSYFTRGAAASRFINTKH